MTGRSGDVRAGPPDTFVERRLHRAFVRLRDVYDRRLVRHEGMATFPDDWRRLMARPPAAVPFERTVWMVWLQGEASAPPMVRAGIESWRARNPGWSVRVLDAAALEREGALPALSDGLLPNHVANIARLRLLARHGGVWADATSWCLRALDDWIGRASVEGFFAFARPQPARSLANWFIAAAPDAPLLRAWLAWSEIYVGDPRPVASYFWQHHTFDWLVWRSRSLDRAWARVPQVSARGPHVVQRLLDGHLSSPPPPEAVRELPLAKLSWKKGYDVSRTRSTLAGFGLGIA
ncbi:MAG: capsular polysaccharide synthesis protein [Paracoccaceae bacterium]